MGLADLVPDPPGKKRFPPEMVHRLAVKLDDEAMAAVVEHGTRVLSRWPIHREARLRRVWHSAGCFRISYDHESFDAVDRHGNVPYVCGGAIYSLRDLV